MRRGVLAGLVAGAAGTVALNVATYADMAIRGRPASGVPSQMAGILAERAGIDLSGGRGEAAKEQAEHRKSGAGALLGYGSGLGVGAAYGLLSPLLRWLPPSLRGAPSGSRRWRPATCRSPASASAAPPTGPPISSPT